jgi:hypothetical protein
MGAGAGKRGFLTESGRLAQPPLRFESRAARYRENARNFAVMALPISVVPTFFMPSE